MKSSASIQPATRWYNISDKQDLPQWSSIQKISFRFIFLFFGLYIFPSPFDFLPYTDTLFSWYNNTWDRLVVNTGKYVLHLPYDITIQPSGSGDTTWNYVQIFVLLLMSVAGCLIWSIIDKNKKSYHRLWYWFTVAIRYYLAFTMFTYGFVKIFKSQFPAPSIFRLLEPYGQSSPMGLAWTFLGYSAPYNYFMGGAEVLSGILLLVRRTNTFGALFCMTVTANVMAINYCFDVPVKLFSTALFLMSVYIAVPQLKRLSQFFFQQKQASLKDIHFSFNTKWKRISALVFKIALLGYVSISTIMQSISSMKLYGDAAPKPKLYGYYNVSTYVKDKDTLAPLLTDTTRWNKILFREYNRITVKMMNDTLIAYTYADDTLKHTITFTQRDDTTLKYSFTYVPVNKDVLELMSVGRKDSIYMQLNKIDVNDFLLMKRGFHWINEYPLNR